MADQKLTDLTAITTPASGDKLYIIDVSDTTDSSDGSSRQITFGNFTATLATLTGTETLTNKTLTAPVISTISNTGTLTLPTSSDTLVGRATTDTLTNKTLTTPIIASLYQDAGKTKLMTVPATASDTLAALAATQNFSNKTFTDQTEFSEDINLATGKNVQVNDVDPNRTITLPATTWAPTTTSGCATLATVEAGTNDIDYRVLDFATDADENAFCSFQMPDSYDGGVIQFRYIWTNAGGGAAETVVFELSGRAYANDDAIDQAVSTPAIEVEDTYIAQGDIHISAWSGDVTLAGSPAAGQWIHLEIMRDISEDDLTGDARLIGVQIRYKQKQYSD